MFKKTILSLLALTIITSVSLAGGTPNIRLSYSFEPDEYMWPQNPFRCEIPGKTEKEYFYIVLQKHLTGTGENRLPFKVVRDCCEKHGPIKCTEFYTKEDINSTFLAAHYGGREFFEYMAYNGDDLDYIFDGLELSTTMKVAQNSFKNSDKAISMLDFAIFKADGNPLTKNRYGDNLLDIAEAAGQTKIAAWVRDVALKAPRFARLSAINGAQKAFTGRIVKFALKDALEEERKTGKLADAIKGSDIFKAFDRWISTNGNKAFSRT